MFISVFLTYAAFYDHGYRGVTRGARVGTPKVGSRNINGLYVGAGNVVATGGVAKSGIGVGPTAGEGLSD